MFNPDIDHNELLSHYTDKIEYYVLFCDGRYFGQTADDDGLFAMLKLYKEDFVKRITFAKVTAKRGNIQTLSAFAHDNKGFLDSVNLTGSADITGKSLAQHDILNRNNQR